MDRFTVKLQEYLRTLPAPPAPLSVLEVKDLAVDRGVSASSGSSSGSGSGSGSKTREKTVQDLARFMSKRATKQFLYSTARLIQSPLSRPASQLKLAHFFGGSGGGGSSGEEVRKQQKEEEEEEAGAARGGEDGGFADFTRFPSFSEWRRH